MAIIVADEVIAAASLDSVTLTRSTLPNVLSSAIEVAMEDIDGQQMDRRSLMTSRAMAAHVLRFHQPARLIQARPEWLSTAAQDTLGARSLLMRRRSLWVDPDGIDSGLLIDRLHHTHLSGLLLDPWMAGKVAADTQAGTAIAKDRFLGVRVLAHRAPQSSIHVTPDGTHHRTGACAHCVGEVI